MQYRVVFCWLALLVLAAVPLASQPGRYERFYDDGWVELWRIRWQNPQSPSR